MDLYGKLKRTYIIAEMSANHAGSKERAFEIIRAAKDSGADCVKIQTYTPDTMTIDCDNEFFRIRKGTWSGETLYQLYKKAYTPWEWQLELKELAESLEMDFLSTPFDRSSVDFLEKMGIEFYKIASFELVDIPLIKYVASKGKPIIMSTGMSSLSEIDEAVRTIRENGNPQLVLLRCSSAYPAITSDMNLKTIHNMSETFNVPIGLSDHSFGSVGAVVAVAMGARVIEKHLCLSRTVDNPDASFSMEPDEFARMVRDVREAEKAIGEVHYGVTKQEKENVLFRRSIFCIQDIKAGDVLSQDNIRIIRPGDGLEPKYYDELLGKRAAIDMKRGTPIRWGCFYE